MKIYKKDEKQEEKVIRSFAILFFLISLVVTSIMFYMPEFHIKVVQAYEQKQAYEKQKKAQKTMDGVELLQYNTDDEQAEAFTQQLKLKLPEGVTQDMITVNAAYMDHTIELIIPNDTMDYLYSNPMVGSSNHIQNLEYWDGSDGLHIFFTMEKILEPVLTVKNNNLYLDFNDPHKVYDKIVVVDAGHGGADPGTVQNGVMEKDLNLSIALKLKEIMEQDTSKTSTESIGVYFTRLTDVNTAYKDRSGLANELKADLFISIHQNALQTTGAEYVNGTQVLYNEQEKKKYRPESGATGQDLARLFLTTMTNQLGSGNRGLVKGHDIYIIRTSKCPTVLLEVGFMSNQAEMEKLASASYQQKAAKAIYAAIRKAFQNGY